MREFNAKITHNTFKRFEQQAFSHFSGLLKSIRTHRSTNLPIYEIGKLECKIKCELKKLPWLCNMYNFIYD